MGKIFPTPWSTDPDYIINLTKHIVGSNILTALRRDGHGRDGHALRLSLWSRIEPKLKEMSSETLGRITAYATAHGMHSGYMSSFPAFINETGFKHVMHWDFDQKKSGRELLEEMALLTIVCVARDIIWQDAWRKKRRADRDGEDDYDRAMADYVHHGHR